MAAPATTQQPGPNASSRFPTLSVPHLDYDSLPTPIPGTRVLFADLSHNMVAMHTLAGSLTTPIAAAAASCRQTYFLQVHSVAPQPDSYVMTEGLDCASHLSVPAGDCMPGHNQTLFATGMVSSKTFIHPTPYFSPATGCPAGYATACTTTLPTGIRAKTNEDVYACCLSGYQCESSSECLYIPKVGETVSIGSCGALTATTVAWRAGFGGSVRSLAIRIIVPREVDAPLQSAAPATLSPGTQAAVGVSAAFAFTIILIAVFLLIRRRRRRRKSSMVTDDGVAGSPPSQESYDGKPSRNGKDAAHEVDAGPGVITESEPKDILKSKPPKELENSFIAELPADEIPRKHEARFTSDGGMNSQYIENI